MPNGEHEHAATEITGLNDLLAEHQRSVEQLLATYRGSVTEQINAQRRAASSADQALGQRLDALQRQVDALGGPTTPPVPTKRFPGDVTAGTIRWGAAVGGNADPGPRHETPAGVPMGLRRTFFQWDQRTGSMVNTARGDLAAGRLPWVSVKAPGWSAMAAGTHDAEIDSMLKALDALNGPVWLTINHEPENDNDAISQAALSAPWRAMQQRIRARMTAVGTKNIALVSTLMSWTFIASSGRNPEDWWVPNTFDIAGIDFYVKNEGVTDLANHPEWKACTAFYKSKGIPLAIGEWGNMGQDVAAADEMTKFRLACIAQGVVGMAYFDSRLNSTSGLVTGWELVGEPLPRFNDLMKLPTSVRLPVA